MKKILNYLWNVIINVFTIFIAIAILNAANDDFQKISFSILILIYASLESFINGHAYIKTIELLNISKKFKEIKNLIVDGKTSEGVEDDEDEEVVEEGLGRDTTIFWIDKIGNSIIYIIALINLFGAL